jgi:hypothetical protein
VHALARLQGAFKTGRWVGGWQSKRATWASCGRALSELDLGAWLGRCGHGNLARSGQNDTTWNGGCHGRV